MTTYIKLKDGSWGIRTDGKARSGQTVTVTKKDGDTKTETIARVLWTGNDSRSGQLVSLCSIETRQKYDEDTVRCRKCGQRTPGGDDWCLVCGAAGYE